MLSLHLNMQILNFSVKDTLLTFLSSLKMPSTLCYKVLLLIHIHKEVWMLSYLANLLVISPHIFLLHYLTQKYEFYNIYVHFMCSFCTSAKGPSINYVTQISWFFFTLPPSLSQVVTFLRPPLPSVTSHISQFIK